MTNEEKEKAREIAEYYTDTNDIAVALNSAKEMAEWKDHQFDMVCNWLRETNIDGLCDSKNLASKFIKKLYELYNGS